MAITTQIVGKLGGSAGTIFTGSSSTSTWTMPEGGKWLACIRNNWEGTASINGVAAQNQVGSASYTSYWWAVAQVTGPTVTFSRLSIYVKEALFVKLKD